MKDRVVTHRNDDLWRNINWKTVNAKVSNLRKRIFTATKLALSGKGSWNKVRSLMRLLKRSFCNLLQAVRRVTKLNKGRNTAGVDGIIALTNEDRVRIIRNWNWNDIGKLPAKRVFIPKSNGKKRPLGIPAIKDRIAQAILLNVIEPAFECRFESKSYGFRPGRSCHDAIEAVFSRFAKGNDRYALDADIKGAFDNISHETVMKEIKHFPGSEMILKWLKAGYVEYGKFRETRSGTPQGGIISPLLANIALDGLQELLSKYTYQYVYYTKGNHGKLKKNSVKKPLFGFSRYADDFIITSQFKEELVNILPIVEEWLGKRGLKLNRDKTHIADIRDGFNFLGVNIKHVKKTNVLIKGSNRHKRLEAEYGRSKKELRKGINRGEDYYACHVTPQEEKIKEFKDEIRRFLRNSGAREFVQVIKELNSKIRGWGNYHKYGTISESFAKLDYYIWEQVYFFLLRRHNGKSKKWIVNKYYTTYKGYNWNPFADYADRRGKTKRTFLIRLTRELPKAIYVGIKGDSSPDDPTLTEYWYKRRCKNIFQPGTKYHTVFKRQEGLCPICGGNLLDELWDAHHIVNIKNGGSDKADNIMLVHKACHQIKHKILHPKDDITDTSLR